MRSTLSSGPDVIPVTELGAVARRITFSGAATPGGPLRATATAVTAAPASSRAAAHGGGGGEPISVVLRVRPLSEAERRDGPAAVQPDTDRPGVVHVVPRNLAVHNAAIRAAERASFRFGRVFGEDVGQAELFRETTAPLVQALFEGRDGLVFAYGTSNAGKTYTIQGEKEAPGILPRSLDVIFNSIAVANEEGTEAAEVSAVSQSVAALVQEEDLLAGGSEERHAAGVVEEEAESGNGEAPPDVFGSDRPREELTFKVSPEPEYAVTVTYLEIYNEQCFDLLVRPRAAARPAPTADDHAVDPAQSTLKERYEPPPNVPARPVKRTVLKLKENRALGEVYAEGLREVTVSSVEDVQRLLSFGQRNRSVAETGVNAHSSRSHTIFCIKLTQRIQLAQKRPGRPAGCHVTTSKLSIVDLAGNERTSRTGNVGQRLKEASLINTSLMNLGFCLEAMRQNQKAAAAAAEMANGGGGDGGGGGGNGRPGLAPIDGNVLAHQKRPRPGGAAKPAARAATVARNGAAGVAAAGGGSKAGKVPARVTVPFRQSRLTRLFQHNLETGTAVMIANVSPAVCDADETIHALRRAAIAREVSTTSAPNRARTVLPDTSRLVSPSLLQDVKKKYETRATADLKKIAGLEAENLHLRSTIEENQIEIESERAQFESERLELEAEVDELFRQKETLLDQLAATEARVAAKECELRAEIMAAAENIMAQRDERHRAELAAMFEEGQVAAQARVAVVTQTARKERLQLTERQRRREEAGERKAAARRVSMAVNLTSVFDEEDDDADDDGSREDGEGGAGAGAGAGVGDVRHPFTLDDLEMDEEEYEFEDDSESGVVEEEEERVEEEHARVAGGGEGIANVAEECEEEDGEEGVPEESEEEAAGETEERPAAAVSREAVRVKDEGTASCGSGGSGRGAAPRLRKLPMRSAKRRP